jgi:HD-like signal output (HDOD) protein
MRVRSTLTATEVDALLSDLGRRLEGVGVETQPEVAAKVLDLVSDPQAGLRQFAEVIRADQSLAGRMLRLANSAYFAQRQPVTNLERACVLLGLERLKALSLGFYLSRAAAGDRNNAISRRIWGEGVYRACLGAEVARHTCTPHAPEALVIGLMMDAGVPIIARLMGQAAMSIIDGDTMPAKQFRAEFETLPYTHVDVVAAMVRRWKLPDLLRRPIECHHTPPTDLDKKDATSVLHRLAYYVGSIRLDPGCVPGEQTPLPSSAERLLGLTTDRLGDIVRRASGEYGAMCDLFREVADSVGDVDVMAERVQRQLIEVIDQGIAAQVAAETRQAGGSFRIADHRVDIELDRQGLATAYLNDAEGNRLLSYAFRPGAEPATAVLEALGVEAVKPADAAALDAFLKSLAA